MTTGSLAGSSSLKDKHGIGQKSVLGAECSWQRWWEWLQGYWICPLQGLRSVWGTPREPEKENDVTSCPVLSIEMSAHEDSWQSSPLSPRISRHLHPGTVAKDTVNSLGESAKPHPQCLTLPPNQLHGEEPDAFQGSS